MAPFVVDDIIIIDSSQRTKSTDDPSSFYFALSILAQGIYRLKYFRGYNSAYNINSTNNLIYYNDGSARTATIPPGYYTAAQLVTAIATQMTGSGGQTYTVVQNASANTLTISAAGGFTVLFGSNTANSCASAMGFKSVDTGSATSQTGSFPMNVDTYRSMRIVVFNSNSSITTIRDKNGPICTFVIPMTDTPTNAITYDPQLNFFYVNFNQPVINIKIQVLDVNNNIIGGTNGLNNQDLYMIWERVAAKDMVVSSV